MKVKKFKNGSSVIIESNNFNSNDVVVKHHKGAHLHVYVKLSDGSLKRLKLIRSSEKPEHKPKQTEAMVSKVQEPIVQESEVQKSKTPISNNETKRKSSWMMFKSYVIKAGGIDIVMKSHLSNPLIQKTLTTYPDFKRGMRLYEAGSFGAWILIVDRGLDNLRKTYKKFYMDLDSLLAA